MHRAGRSREAEETRGLARGAVGFARGPEDGESRVWGPAAGHRPRIRATRIGIGFRFAYRAEPGTPCPASPLRLSPRAREPSARFRSRQLALGKRECLKVAPLRARRA